MSRPSNPFALPRAALAILAAGILILATPAASAAWPGCEVDWFVLSASGDTVTVDHNGVSYNCCMDHVEWVVELTGSTLQIFEYEIAPEPCAYLCCFELSVSVADCPSGLLEVEFHWDNSESGQWETWTGTIFVPEVGQAPLPVVASSETSDCLPFGTSAPPPEDPRPWAVVKAWYRAR